MAVLNPSLGRVFCPESFVCDLSTNFSNTSLPELQDCTYSPQTGQEFDTHFTNNTICAILNIGSVQHPESYLNTDIPFYCCNFCDFQSVQKAELQKHLQIHRFGCKFCNVELFTRAEVIRHAVTCHKAVVTYEIIRYCVFSKEGNGVVENSEINLRRESSLKKRNLECDEHNNLPNKTIKVEPVDNVLKECSVKLMKCNDLNETRSPANASSHSFSNESTRTFDQNSEESVSYNSGTAACDSPGTSASTQDASQSFLRNILTSDVTGKSSPTVSIIKKEDGNAFQAGVRMVSLLKSPAIPQDTADRNENQREKISETVNGPKVKIEVDNDSYIARLQYYPETTSTQESNSTQLQIQNNRATNSRRNNFNSSSETSCPTSTSSPPRKRRGRPPNPSSISQENGRCSEGKQDKSLPILRTMLTKSGKPSRSSARSQISADSDGESDEDSLPEEEGDNDDEDDEDYRPSTSYTYGEAQRGQMRCSPRVRKDGDEFSCVHCQGIAGKFVEMKDHIFEQHNCSNLVLKDCSRNIMVFICPMPLCEYRDPRFLNFMRHLEACGVFTHDSSMPMRSDEKRAKLLALVTLRSLLENVNTEWRYACNICAHLFNSLSEAQKHKMKKHPHCNADKSLLKNYPDTNEVGVICLLCLAEFDVLQWPELSTQSCEQHQAEAGKTNKTAQSSLKEDVISTGTDKKMSELPSNSKDQTPQLRAMLQRKSRQVHTRSHDSQQQDLPASRMLQWLIKEAGRMMHMLKE